MSILERNGSFERHFLAFFLSFFVATLIYIISCARETFITKSTGYGKNDNRKTIPVKVITLPECW